MKTLELNQMEGFIGGQTQSESAECIAARVAYAAALVATVFTFGWASPVLIVAQLNMHVACSENV